MRERGPMSTNAERPEVAVKVRVLAELGLHARPAARLAQAAQLFASDINLESGGRSVDAKSILDLLSLAATKGTELTLRCQGPDAARAAETLAGFFRANQL